MSNTLRKKIYLSPPHLNGEEINFIKDALDSNWVAPLGPHVEAFEKEVAEYIGIDHALAVSSGTAALHLALNILDIKKGDTVFCSDLTFVAAANAILYQNAQPVFIDCDKETWTMCPASLQKAFAAAEKEGVIPKAVIITDIYGQSANYDKLNELCKKYAVPVVADAAEAVGSEYKGRKCGSIGDLNVLSFNGNKIITTSSGGMLLSRNAKWITRAHKLATQSREKTIHYEHRNIGFNYRLSNILAALGRGQLSVVEDRVRSRRKIFDTYVNGLAQVEGIDFMPEAEYGKSNRWLTVCVIDPEKTGVNRDAVITALESENIESRPIWKPMHLQPLYSRKKIYNTAENPYSGKLFQDGICLPSGSNLTTNQQGDIIDHIIKFLSK